MKVSRLGVLGAMSAAAIIGLTACGAGDAGSDDVTEMTVAVDSFTIGTPVFVAEQEGYFEEGNLDVEAAIFQTGVEGVQALTTGQVDFAFAMDFAAVSSVSDKLVILGAVSSPEPGFHKFYLATELDSPEDLAGNAVGVLPGTAQAYSTQLWLEKYGVADDVEMVEFPGVYELVGALRSGDIQGGFIFGAGLAEAENVENIAEVGDDSEVLALQGMYLMSTREYVENNAEATTSLLTALGEAATFTAENVAEAAEITATETKGDAEAIEPSLAISSPGLRFLEGHRENLVRIQEFLIDIDRIPADTDVEASLDLELMKKIEGAEVE